MAGALTPVFLHVGDVHLEAGNPRNGDRVSALDQVVSYAEGLGARLAFTALPGDVFHAVSTAEDRNTFAELVRCLAAVAPVVIVAGNHDAPGDLEIFGLLETVWPVAVVTTPRVVAIETPAHGRASVFCLPYPFKASLVGRSDGAAIVEQTFGALCAEAGARLLAERAAGRLVGVFGHVSIAGAVASTGQPQIGHELELDPALLEAFPGIYCGFNHIHKHQTVGRAVYAGSVARLDFGEREPKGFVAVTATRAYAGEPWAYEWELVPLAVPRMVRVEGRLEAETFTPETVDGVPFDPAVHTAAFWSGADVAVRYTVARADIGVAVRDRVTLPFAGARLVKPAPVVVAEHAVRAPEIAAAVTLEAKVRAYCGLHGLDVSDGLLAKLAGLEAADGGAAAVAAVVEACGGEGGAL